MALPKSGFNDQSAASAAPEGGGDAVLALTSTVQSQANSLAVATQAAAVSIDHASEQLSDIFAQVMSGRALLDATLAKTYQKLEAQGTIEIDTEVQPIALDLPKLGDFNSTRQRFLGLFGGAARPENPFLVPAEAASYDEVDGDD